MTFHRRSGPNAVVLPGGIKAYNNRANNGFGTVMTSRPLRKGELFQVKGTRLFDIGVTTSSPEKLEFPKFMSSAGKLGPTAWTWLPPYKFRYGRREWAYGPAKNPFTPADVVGVMVTKDNYLHFYQNGMDVGEVPKVVTGTVYGFIDIYSKTVVEIIYER